MLLFCSQQAARRLLRGHTLLPPLTHRHQCVAVGGCPRNHTNIWQRLHLLRQRQQQQRQRRKKGRETLQTAEQWCLWHTLTCSLPVFS